MPFVPGCNYRLRPVDGRSEYVCGHAAVCRVNTQPRCALHSTGLCAPGPQDKVRPIPVDEPEGPRPGDVCVGEVTPMTMNKDVWNAMQKERRERLAAQMLAAFCAGLPGLLACDPDEIDARINAALVYADKLIVKLDGRTP